jgi:hypothetical protein
MYKPKNPVVITINIGNQVPTRKGTNNCDGTTNNETNAHPNPYVPANRTRLNISRITNRINDENAITLPIGQ